MVFERIFLHQVQEKRTTTFEIRHCLSIIIIFINEKRYVCFILTFLWKKVNLTLVYGNMKDSL